MGPMTARTHLRSAAAGNQRRGAREDPDAGAHRALRLARPRRGDDLHPERERRLPERERQACRDRSRDRGRDHGAIRADGHGDPAHPRRARLDRRREPVPRSRGASPRSSTSSSSTGSRRRPRSPASTRIARRATCSHAAGREIYLRFPAGSGKTKLTLDWFERQLGVKGTARNWNTLLKLIALTEA